MRCDRKNSWWRFQSLRPTKPLEAFHFPLLFIFYQTFPPCLTAIWEEDGKISKSKPKLLCCDPLEIIAQFIPHCNNFFFFCIACVVFLMRRVQWFPATEKSGDSKPGQPAEEMSVQTGEACTHQYRDQQVFIFLCVSSKLLSLH